MMGPRRAAAFASALLSACGPSFAPHNAPGVACPIISGAEFDDAMRAGATAATATVDANGVVSLDVGPGAVRCATYRTAMKPCVRPNDFVIRYTLSDGEQVFVRVPAGSQYRFRIGATPTPCEIVNQN